MSLNQKRCVQLFNNLNLPVIVYDIKAGKISELNSAALHMFEYRESELLHHTYEKLVMPVDKEIIKQIIEKESNFSGSAGVKMVTSNGNIYFAEISYIKIADEDSSLLVLIIKSSAPLYGYDADDYKTDDRFKIIANQAPVLVYMTDKTGSRTYVNKGWLEFTGGTMEEQLGNDWTNGIHPDDKYYVLEIFKSAFQKRENLQMEYRLRRFDGEFRWVLDQGRPRYNEKGEFFGYIGSCVDITGRKNVEQELSQALTRERKAFAEVELIHQKHKFLFEASSILAASLDYKKSLTSVAKLAAPIIADWCKIDLANEEGELKQLTVSHHNFSKIEEINRLYKEYPQNKNEEFGRYKVFTEGKSEIFNHITEEEIEKFARDERHLTMLMEIGISSVIIVPMIARGRKLGVITLVWSNNGKYYDSFDLSLLESLALRSALAIDNAQLFFEVKKANEELEKRVRDRTLQYEAANLELEREIKERRRAAEELRIRARQQSVVAELGQLALSGIELQELSEQTVDLVANTINAKLCNMLELQRDGKNFILKAGVGWREGIIGSAVINAGPETHAGFTMQSSSPVIVEDYNEERRFKISPLLKEHKIRSSIAVVISERGRKYGILSVHSVEANKFNRNDANFLTSVANVLAAAIERKQAEERFKGLLESAPDSFVIVDKSGTIILVNSQTENLFKYSRDELIGRPVELLMPERFREIHPKHRNMYYENPQTRPKGTFVELWGRTKEGKEFPIEISLSPLETEAGILVSSAIRDISERKRAEETLRLQAQIVSQIHDSVIGTDMEGKITSWNRGAEKLFGYKIGEVKGKDISIIYPDSRINLLQKEIIQPVLKKGEHEIETKLRKKSGVKFDALVSLSLLKNYKGEVKGLIGYTLDITQSKQAEAALQKAHDELEHRVKERTSELSETNKALQIEIEERKRAKREVEASLKEKELLLKEIHHRVKNNLQIISSLLSLQAKNIEDEYVREAFMESQNRIRTMALIHERLYKPQEISKINFAEYVNDLTKNLFQSYRTNASAVQLKTRIDEVKLSMDMAISLGLIINELVSNALKHAFKENREGKIHITLRAETDGGLTLIVTDNGSGFPESIDYKDTDSLGLQLVMTLVEQHSGHVQLTSHNGTKFKIVFDKMK